MVPDNDAFQGIKYAGISNQHSWYPLMFLIHDLGVPVFDTMGTMAADDSNHDNMQL